MKLTKDYLRKLIIESLEEGDVVDIGRGKEIRAAKAAKDQPPDLDLPEGTEWMRDVYELVKTINASRVLGKLENKTLLKKLKVAGEKQLANELEKLAQLAFNLEMNLPAYITNPNNPDITGSSVEPADAYKEDPARDDPTHHEPEPEDF